MADYTYKELMRMQSDAVRRVEDMQRRARQVAGIDEDNTDEAQQNPVAVKREPHHIPQPEGYLPKPEKSNQHTSVKEQTGMPFLDGIKKNFDKFDIDEDKALILSLVLLLSGENADEGLLTALIYMLT